MPGGPDGSFRAGGSRWGRRRDQLSFIPLSLNTRFQRSSSLRTKASNSSGVLLTALMPDFSSFSAMTGSAYMLTTSRWTLSTMARGVPAGATNPIQVEMSSSAGMPASTASGLTSGKAGSGRLLSLASARNLPLWMSGRLVGGAVDDVVDRAGQE